jgi:hypothetical protein
LTVISQDLGCNIGHDWEIVIAIAERLDLYHGPRRGVAIGGSSAKNLHHWDSPLDHWTFALPCRRLAIRSS